MFLCIFSPPLPLLSFPILLITLSPSSCIFFLHFIHNRSTISLIFNLEHNEILLSLYYWINNTTKSWLCCIIGMRVKLQNEIMNSLCYLGVIKNYTIKLCFHCTIECWIFFYCNSLYLDILQRCMGSLQETTLTSICV